MLAILLCKFIVNLMSHRQETCTSFYNYVLTSTYNCWFCSYYQKFHLCSKLFVIGGQSIRGHLLNSVEVYDTVKEKWHSDNPFPIAIRNPCAISFRGRLYVFGGDSNDGLSNRAYW